MASMTPVPGVTVMRGLACLDLDRHLVHVHVPVAEGREPGNNRGAADPLGELVGVVQFGAGGDQGVRLRVRGQGEGGGVASLGGGVCQVFGGDEGEVGLAEVAQEEHGRVGGAGDALRCRRRGSTGGELLGPAEQAGQQPGLLDQVAAGQDRGQVLDRLDRRRPGV